MIPDTHPDFNKDVIELELAEFKFSNGKVAYGVYNGSESFDIITADQWYSFWYGGVKPEQTEIDRLSCFLLSKGYELPVEASAKWSKITKAYNGVQYINDDGDIIEIAI